MDRVRDVCSLGLSIRKANNRRVRLPLAEMTITHPDADALRSFADLIADEVNVKNVVLAADAATVSATVLQVVPAAVGPRLGGRTQEVIRAVKEGRWVKDGDRVVAGDIELRPGEFILKLAASEGGATMTTTDGQGLVAIDVAVTPELDAEGRARDLVRLVQQARREAGLLVSDRIVLTLGVPEFVRRNVQPFITMIATETLATTLEWGIGEPNAQLDDDDVFIGVRKA
ncbi:MAG: DUF5915 domain-containing protein [Actinomycetota bacterium]